MQEKNKGTVFSHFWRYTKGIRGYFLLAVVTAFMAILFGFLTPQIIRITVDSVIGTEPFELPAFLLTWLENMGGREALRSSLLLCGAAVLICTVVEG
ncbi:MAG: ABC transporter ATP-binding protein, partial [Clostridia bacterium]|nr:ABC transporter ATP-binding protein [Clostridia bacterium]